MTKEKGGHGVIRDRPTIQVLGLDDRYSGTEYNPLPREKQSPKTDLGSGLSGVNAGTASEKRVSATGQASLPSQRYSKGGGPAFGPFTKIPRGAGLERATAGAVSPAHERTNAEAHDTLQLKVLLAAPTVRKVEGSTTPTRKSLKRSVTSA